ncbi:MAG: TolC family protein [Bacteroidetes bacterium]|nr:TolC family protein [Bacteroidota bacterium]
MRLFFSLLIILTFSIYSYGQKLLSLNEAISIALHRNTALQKSVNNISSSESNLKAAWGGLLPTVSAQGGWQWSYSKQQGTPINIGSFVYTPPSTTTQTRNYSASANASWTLFDGLASITNVSLSQKELESAKLQLENLKQNTVFQTISLYYAVINNQQLLKVKEDNVAWNKRNVETVTERNKLGAVTLADVYSAQVQEGNAELDLIQTNNNLEVSKSQLLYFLGLDVLQNYSFSDSLTTQEENILQADISEQYTGLDEMVKEALANRADYKSAILDYESAQNGITVAEGSYFPRLTNSYSYNTYANQLRDLNKSKNFSVGLNLNIPIFEGFSIDNRVELAKVNAMNKKVDLDDLSRNIKQSLQQTYLNAQAAKKGLDVNKRTMQSAEENLKIAQEKYSLGSGTLLDVLIANSNYTTARTNYINSEFQYIILNEQLKYYLGILSYKNYE